MLISVDMPMVAGAKDGDRLRPVICPRCGRVLDLSGGMSQGDSGLWFVCVRCGCGFDGVLTMDIRMAKLTQHCYFATEEP